MDYVLPTSIASPIVILKLLVGNEKVLTACRTSWLRFTWVFLIFFWRVELCTLTKDLYVTFPILTPEVWLPKYIIPHAWQTWDKVIFSSNRKIKKKKLGHCTYWRNLPRKTNANNFHATQRFCVAIFPYGIIFIS